MTGYSERAFQEEFRTSMKHRIVKNFRNLCIGFAAAYLLIALLMVFLTKKQEKGFGFYTAAMAIILIIFAVMLILYGIKAFRQRRKLEDPPIDVTVVKNVKRRTASNRRNGRRTRYMIVLETKNGDKIKVKNETARPYHRLLEAGDEVRYHPGFIYPIELSDKSGVNVCAFCGKENDADICARCGNPMLI